MVDGSSLLLDLDGVVVESVRRSEDGTRLVVVGTAAQWVGVCPECGERSTTSTTRHGAAVTGFRQLYRTTVYQ